MLIRGLKYLLAVLLVTSNLWAVFCPNCGVKNNDRWNHCFDCGESLEEVKRWMQKRKKKTTSPSKSGRKIKTYHFTNDSEDEGEEYEEDSNVKTIRIKNRKSKKQRHSKIKTSRHGKTYQGNRFGGTLKGGRTSGNPTEILEQLMGGSGATTLLQYKNRDVSESDLQRLNQDPQVNQLVNQMKNRNYQQSILEGLRSIGPKGRGSAKHKSQIQQVQMLFELLNTQGLQNDSGSSPGI